MKSWNSNSSRFFVCVRVLKNKILPESRRGPSVEKEWERDEAIFPFSHPRDFPPMEKSRWRRPDSTVLINKEWEGRGHFPIFSPQGLSSHGEIKVEETRARICRPCKEPKNRFWALRAGTTTLHICRTGPPGYIDWRNWFLGIDSWAP